MSEKKKATCTSVWFSSAYHLTYMGKKRCVKLFKQCSVKLGQCTKVFYFRSSPPLPPWPQYLPQSPCPIHQLTGGKREREGERGADFSPMQCRDLLTCTRTAKRTEFLSYPPLYPFILRFLPQTRGRRGKSLKLCPVNEAFKVVTAFHQHPDKDVTWPPRPAPLPSPLTFTCLDLTLCPTQVSGRHQNDHRSCQALCAPVKPVA